MKRSNVLYYILVSTDNKLTVDFNGGNKSSNGGLLLLREKERALGVCRLPDAMPDRRDADRIRHAMFEMVMARVGAIACGYEDGNDLDLLRHDHRNWVLTQQSGKYPCHALLGLEDLLIYHPVPFCSFFIVDCARRTASQGFILVRQTRRARTIRKAEADFLRSPNIVPCLNFSDSPTGAAFDMSEWVPSTSLWEGFNPPFLDEQAQGTPVLAYAQGPHAEVVRDGETEILVNGREIMLAALLALSSARFARAHLQRPFKQIARSARARIFAFAQER